MTEFLQESSLILLPGREQPVHVFSRESDYASGVGQPGGSPGEGVGREAPASRGMKPNPTALLIDSDRPIRRLLRNLLEPHHYRVGEAENGAAGIKEAVARRPDVVILEPELPDLDGLEVLKRLREWNPVPVLILSARADEESKVAALDAGAEDYLTKPFGSAELLARLRVLQRAERGEPDGPLYIHGGLRVDSASHLVTLGGREVELTPTEEAVFYTLVRHAGKVVTCEFLLRCVWGTDSESKLHDLHVYIRCLRRKLQSAAAETLIRTEGSVGYRLALPPECPSAPADELTEARPVAVTA